MAVKGSSPDPAPRARNTRGQGARLRQELLEAAVRVLDRSASADVTLRTVAQEAGVSPQAVYAHFSGRQDLNYEVVRYCWQQVAEEMARAARRARLKPAAERVRVQLRAYLRYAMKSPARYQALFGLHPELDGPDQLRVRPAEPATLELLRDVEAMYAEDAGLPLLDATECTVLLLSFVHGRVALALTAPDRPWNSLRSISLYVDQVMRGLFGQREPSGEPGA